jgi:hypothetical protein
MLSKCYTAKQKIYPKNTEKNTQKKNFLFNADTYYFPITRSFYVKSIKVKFLQRLSAMLWRGADRVGVNIHVLQTL